MRYQRPANTKTTTAFSMSVTVCPENSSLPIQEQQYPFYHQHIPTSLVAFKIADCARPMEQPSARMAIEQFRYILALNDLSGVL